MSAAASELLISSDSHVMENPDLWAERLPAGFRDRAPSYEHVKKRASEVMHPGASDSHARVGEMQVDGVSGEVLYPTIALDQFGIEEPALQEACFRVYNDWLGEYCSVAPDRLFGIACISLYDVEAGIRELERSKQLGMRGALIWQVPPAEYSFAGDHYERFWAAAAELDMPISLHILTGTPFPPGNLLGRNDRTPTDRVRNSVNLKLQYAADAMLEIIGTGALDRHPNLKFVLVENELSWMPFLFSQWDKYIGRGGPWKIAAQHLPSHYLGRNIFATFFNDPPVRWFLQEWGADFCMWSNDYPHPNSTWPHSREVIARDLGHLDAATRTKLVSENCAKLYGIRTGALVAP